MPDCQVPWGQEALTVPLPEHWTLQQVASPSIRPAAPDWQDRLAIALSRPEGSKPLAEMLADLPPTGRIAIIVEDVTRHSPLEDILPIVLRELEHARIRDEQVEVVFACGMHPAVTPQQARQKIGPLIDRFAWRCNAAGRKGAHAVIGRVSLPGGRAEMPVAIDRGVVQADLRIVVCSVSPHLQAGFGGGAKMLVPGCASIDTISRMHLAGLPKQGRQLVGTEPEGNPMRTLIDASGDLLAAGGRQTFAVQYVLDTDDYPSSIVAGGLREGQQMLAKLCASSAGIVVDSPADVLIVNAAPRDFDLWQSFKCIANTRWAVRENGVIVVLARCPGGLNMPSPRWPVSPKWTRRAIRWLGTRGIVSLFDRLCPGANGEARFFTRLACETISRNHIILYAPELVRRAERFPGLPITDDLPGALATAEELLGNGSRRAIVFTAGGSSYPVIKP